MWWENQKDLKAVTWSSTLANEKIKSKLNPKQIDERK